MKQLLCIFFILTAIFCNSLHAQVAPQIEWQKCLGGYSTDVANSIQQTNDGGFVVAGYSLSTDGDVNGNNGDFDFWVVKLNESDHLEWQKCLGGSGNDAANSIQETSDEGFIIVGSSFSNDGDVSGWHSGYDNYGILTTDIWITKLDIDGNLDWQKSLGGSGNDVAYSVQQTTDGGFIVAGNSFSDDGDVSGNHGGYYYGDYWIVKLDANGNLLWQKSLGGSGDDVAYSIQQTDDESFIVAGYSTSNDGDVSGNQGGWDYWIVKLDGVGNILWEKYFGGSGYDTPFVIQEVADDDYIVAGVSNSTDGNLTENHGQADYWIMKLDSLGNLLWEKSLGGSGDDLAYSVQQTTDGGFVVAGNSSSYDGNISGWHPGYDSCGHPATDFWIIKLDSLGNLVWEKCLSGSSFDGATSIQQAIDGGFIIAGYTESDDDDVLGNHGDNDYWIVKIRSDMSGVTSVQHNFISLSPNPVQNLLTINLLSPSVATIAVYDVEGRITVLPTSITNNTAQLTTTTLPNGIYLLQIINEETGESEVGKFVKGK